MRKLIGIPIIGLLGALCQAGVLAESAAYVGSHTYFHHEIQAAGRQALSRSALARRHRKPARQRKSARADVWQQLAKEDREKGYFRIPTAHSGAKSSGHVRQTGRFHRPVSDGSYHPPVSDGSFHPPVSDGKFRAPSSAR